MLNNFTSCALWISLVIALSHIRKHFFDLCNKLKTDWFWKLRLHYFTFFKKNIKWDFDKMISLTCFTERCCWTFAAAVWTEQQLLMQNSQCVQHRFDSSKHVFFSCQKKNTAVSGYKVILSTKRTFINMKLLCGAIVTSPRGKEKKTPFVIWKCAPLHSCFYPCVLYPSPQMILKVILRNLESWFTAPACHLNQVSQWNETKVLTPAWAQREGRAKRRLTVVLFWPWFRWGLLHCFHALSPFSFSSVQWEGLRRG